MKKRIEKAVFMRDAEEAAPEADRVYYGNEFCEYLIPQLSSLRRAFRRAKDARKGFTFVTPFVTNAGLRKLEPLFAFLDKERGVEIVCNDWGVLALLGERFGNCAPVLGRLLTKQRRDPRILKIFSGKQKFRKIHDPEKGIDVIMAPKKVPPELFEHFRGSLVNVPLFQEYLLSRRIRRLEIDNLMWEMKLSVDAGIGVSVYLPFGYVTTSRKCGKLTMSYAACREECKKYYLKLRGEALPAPFYGIGNTIFYESHVPPEAYLKKLGIDRIVWQPGLPF